jgi:insulysin
VTLRDEPAAAGIDVRAALLAFHSAHYAPARATLAVLGAAPLAELEGWVRAAFGSWAPAPGAAPAPPPVAGSPHGGAYAGLLLRRVPVRDSRSVRVSWALPAQRGGWRGKPASVVGHCVGHEGAGSLLSALIARSWAQELYGGLSEDASGFALFELSIDLTEEGLANVDGVLALAFAYVGMLAAHGPQEWLWREDAALRAAAFRFASKREPWPAVVAAATALALFPPAQALSGERLLFEYDAAGVAAVLAALTPEAARVTLVSKSLDGAATPLTEKWYGTKYAVEPLGAPRVAALRAARDAYQALTAARIAAKGGAPVTGGAACLPPAEAAARAAAAEAALAAGGAPSPDDAARAIAADPAAIFPPLTLPQPNAFIATDFSLRDAGAEARRRGAAGAPAAPAPFGATVGAVRVRREPVPARLRGGGSARGEVWLHSDDFFALPKVALFATLALPGAARAGPAGAAALDLVAALINERLREEGYDARLASLNYSVSRAAGGLAMSVRGFSHHAPPLLARIAALAAAPAFSDAAFALRKDALLRRYANSAKNSAAEAAAATVSGALGAANWSALDDLLPALAPMTAASLRTAAPRLLGGAAALVFACGNADAATARAADAGLAAALAAAAAPGDAPPTADALAATRARATALPRPLALSGGARIAFDVVRRLPARNAAEPNAAVELAVQLGALSLAPRDAALAYLAAHLVAEPFFDELRTRQQLGYVVQSALRVDGGVASLRFIVQSTKLRADALRARVEEFLAGSAARVRAMAPEAFAANVAAVATARAEADKSLEAEAARLWAEIAEPGRLEFARATRDVTALLALTQDDAAAFFADRVAPGGALRAAVVATIERGADSALPGAPPAAEDGEGEGDDEGEDDAEDDGAVSGASPADGLKAPVGEDALAGGGAPVLPPGAELDAPLSAVAAALAAVAAFARAGEEAPAAAVAAAFAAAGIAHVGDALRAGERVIRVQAVAATRDEVHAALGVWPDFDALRRATLPVAE